MYRNSDLLRGLEFDYNKQASLDRGAKPRIDFNAFLHCFHYIDMKQARIRGGQMGEGLLSEVHMDDDVKFAKLSSVALFGLWPKFC